MQIKPNVPKTDDTLKPSRQSIIDGSNKLAHDNFPHRFQAS